MTEQDLRHAGVTFIAQPHSYRRDCDGKELQGVTAMIQQCLFPDEYAAVDAGVLDAKARYGTQRHHEIQDMIVFGDEPETDAQRKFAAMMADAALEPIASEYTVTDGENFASNIDVVCSDGSLIDIKTCASLNRNKVSWQLSLYAMMFELTNPGLKVGRLFATWIPKVGAPRLVEVPRKPDEDLLALMQAWVAGEPYAYNSKLDRGLVEGVTELKYTIARLEEQLAEMTANLLLQMQERGERSYKDEWVSLSYREAGTSSRFDSSALKAADPETYQKYVTSSATKPTLTIRIK